VAASHATDKKFAISNVIEMVLRNQERAMLPNGA
jgi:hypothetical protein